MTAAFDKVYEDLDSIRSGRADSHALPHQAPHRKVQGGVCPLEASAQLPSQSRSNRAECTR